jgi:hypothetical protein
VCGQKEHIEASNRYQLSYRTHLPHHLPPAEHRAKAAEIAKEQADAKAALAAVDLKLEAEYDAINRPGNAPAEPPVVELTKDEREILQTFEAFKIGAGEYLPVQSFDVSKLPPPLRQRRQEVFQSMYDRGILKPIKLGWVLTELGSQLLYGE